MRAIFFLLTVIDLLAVFGLLYGGEPAVQPAISWLLLYSCVPAWLMGAQVAKDQVGSHTGSARSLAQILAVSSLAFVACAAVLTFPSLPPDRWPALYLMVLVYALRLAPGAAFSVLLCPFLALIADQKALTAVSAVVCQVCAWTGAYLLMRQNPDWAHQFLTYSLWVPYWGFSLALGGMATRFSRPKPPARQLLESR